MRHYRADTWTADVLEYLFRQQCTDWPQWPLTWLDYLVQRKILSPGDRQSSQRYGGFWTDLTHRERLGCLLQLLIDPASLAEQKRLIAIDREKHPTRVEFPSARHTLKRWQLSQVHSYLTTVGKVNPESYQRVLEALQPTQFQIDDFYRYQIWLMANAKTPGQLAGLAELIGATPLSAEQVWHHLKRHCL